MKRHLIAMALAITAVATLVFAYGGPNPLITGQPTVAPATDPTNSQVLDGATLPYNVTQIITVTANDDTTNVTFSCPDQLVGCKNDGERPFTRNFTPNSAGAHSMTFQPWGSPGGNIQGPTVTVHYTTANP